MYLYFGKDGKLKTKINHDAPPRQGGDLNVTVCLDMDFWDDKERWGVDGDKYWVKTARIKSASGVLGYPQIATEGQIEVFSKLYNSEIVYDLVPGASYLMYKFRFSAEEVTKIPGQINFELSMQNISFSDNKYVRIGTRSEFIKMVENPGNGENCISRELNDLTGKISSVVYKKGNGTQAFSDLSPVSGYQVGTYQERMDKSETATEGFVFVQQDKNPDEYTYGEVSIWMWAKATGADTTLGWIQLPQYSTTDIIPTDGTFAFGVTDITIERTVGYARALIDKEIGIKYQDIMDEFKRVYSKIAIAGTKPDWNVGENTSPAYIYNKPNIKTVLVDDIGSIRETGVYIVKNSTGSFPIYGDYVLLHYADSNGNHIQLVFENQNITWFRSLPSGGKGFGLWESREIREALKWSGAPDSSTPGIVGQFYFDLSSKYLYYCVSAINNVYTWERLVNLTYFDSEKKSIIEQINALKNKDETINGQIANLETSINNLSSDITTITSGLNEKFDKTGGTIYGDVTVTGIVLSNEGISTKSNVSADGSIEGKDLTVHNNAVIEGNATIVGSLTVQGAVTSVETTNVSIKDQLFEIAKGDKGNIGLNSPAGFYVSNYDGQGNNLAIVFDKTGTAYVGDVSIGENGLISDTSHLQPFATRQTTEIQDKSILQWDQQSNSLKDSGKTIDDFVEKKENNTGYNCLYGQDVNNNVELVRMSQNKDQNTVPLRTEGGRLKGGQAKENDEFVTLQQLDDSESRLSEQVDFLEDKINETIAVNPGKTYILIVGDSVTFTVRNDAKYSVDMGDGTIYANISNVTKTHNYTRKGSAHIITVSGVGTNGDFGFSLGEDQNLAFRSIHFGEGIKKITNFLVSTPVDVCILPKTITDVLSDNFTDGNATLKYAKSVYCLSETPFTISKNVFANSLRIFVKRDSLDQYKQAWYQHLPASIIVSEVDSSDLVNEIVQTTGQSTTAVMSQKSITDEITALKSDLVDVEVLRTVNFLTSNSGFISAGGVYNSSSNFKITEPFEVKKGEKIKLTASGYNTSVSMITQWINDDYHPLVVCRSSNEEEYEYVAESDMEIILSYNSLLEYSSVIVRPIVSYVDSECKKLDDKIEAEKNKTIDVDFTGDEFGYYNPWGTFYDAPNFKHTKPFILYEGETVTLVASEYNDSISAIARYNGGVVTSLVRSTQTEETTYSYTAEEDMYIILCYNFLVNHYAKIKMTAKSQLKRSGVDFDELPNYSMMFESMCGIGDSLMSGALSYRDSQGKLQGKDIYGNSWLSTIARENGATRKHLSSGGKTTKAWITSYADELMSDPVYSAYFIGLGTNDAYFKEYELGTINDDKGTDTFVGYYKDVIERVRAKAPNSAIFCLSLYSNATGYDAYSNMIEQITKLYSGVFFVDFINKSDVIIETDGYSSAGHFTTLGYVRVAKNIKKIVNDVIKNNMSYFNMYAWDNTSSNR